MASSPVCSSARCVRCLVNHRPRYFLMQIPSILVLGFVYVAYVLIGGVVFWKLEGDLGMKDVSYLREKKERLLSTYPCLNQAGLEAVAQVRNKNVGLSLKSNYTADGFWKFTSSAVFAATVVTTIGYGNICPSTTGGQIFCVFFALFGIPLNIVVLNRVGKKRLTCTRFFIHFVCYICGAVLFFIMPMIVFKQQEDWTHAEAIYYCFISLSTIGFGDFVADSNPDKYYPNWYSFIIASWIFFGMAWLALVINHSIEILERLNNYFKKQFKKNDNQQGDEAGGTADKNPETQMEEEDEITHHLPTPWHQLGCSQSHSLLK
uniref:Potassium channel, subfamily K, member 17 n=1 Tax=Haplochromis burtoni TaxID=8153 RepID=A0A3Q2VKW1_HAPBU